jgi:uncharacterized protein YkwD
MARSKVRRVLRFDNLEARQLLSAGGPTNEEQYMLQLINEARTNPAAAAAQITSNLTPEVEETLQYYNVNLQAVEQTIANATPQPPVAWNADLAAAALTQSNYQAQNQVQSHNGANGSTPLQRIQQAGYTNVVSNNENAYAYSQSALEAMQAFLIDWGVPSDGHRITIQQPNTSAQNAYRDVGIGIVQTPANSSVGPEVVTQDFASQANEQAQVVGVAYDDNAHTNFYEPGEGQGGLQIDAVNLQTGQVFSTQTWSSGGYELALAPGQYRLIASLNNEVFQASNITVGNVNIEQDFVLTNTWQGGTRASAIAAATPVAAPPVTSSQPTPAAMPTMLLVNPFATKSTSQPTPGSATTSQTTPASTPTVTVVNPFATQATSQTTPASTPTVTINSLATQAISQPTPASAPIVTINPFAAAESSDVTPSPTQPITINPFATSQVAPASTSSTPGSMLALFANSWSAWNASVG